MSYDTYAEIYKNKTILVENLLNQLSNNTNDWNNCFEVDFLLKNTIPVINYNTIGYYKKMNLYNFLSTFQENVLTI